MATRLYFPGPITGVLGLQGAGKTFAALKFALQVAETLEYDLCFNFSIDLKKLFYYCLDCGYSYLLGRILSGDGVRCRSSADLQAFMDRPKTLYLLDEAGVYLNSRRFRDISVDFISDLAQIRHDGKLLWWVAQYADMVDRVLRELTASFLVAESTLRFNKKLGNSEIIWQNFALFDNKKFKLFEKASEDRARLFAQFFRKRKYAIFTWGGMLSPTDKYLFKVYKSFGSKVGGDIELINKNFYKRKYTKVNHHEIEDTFDRQKIFNRLTKLGVSYASNAESEFLF